jgi:hypothetical protein
MTKLWQVYKDGKSTFIISSGKVREADCIATINKPYEDRASLIASAPELLEACIEARSALSILSPNGFVIDKLQQAIAKAEGK